MPGDSRSRLGRESTGAQASLLIGLITVITESFTAGARWRDEERRGALGRVFSRETSGAILDIPIEKGTGAERASAFASTSASSRGTEGCQR